MFRKSTKLRIVTCATDHFARSEMGWRDRVKLVGKPTKRFRVWRIDVYGKPYACEGDYDTVQALNAHRWRSDWDYKIQVGRRFMAPREFDDWAKSNSQMVTRKIDSVQVIDVNIVQNIKTVTPR